MPLSKLANIKIQGILTIFNYFEGDLPCSLHPHSHFHTGLLLLLQAAHLSLPTTAWMAGSKQEYNTLHLVLHYCVLDGTHILHTLLYLLFIAGCSFLLQNILLFIMDNMWP